MFEKCFNNSFDEKVALVVGGASGIGNAVCRKLMNAGCKVAWTHLGSEKGKIGTAELRDFAGSEGLDCKDGVVDCTDEKATRQFTGQILNDWKRIDFLIFSAGYTSPVGFLELNADEWRRIVDINLNGAFVSIHAVLPAMLEQGSGGIVMIGSAAVASGGGGRADYVSAKAGLEGLNLALTREFAPKGIRCNLVHPSLIETDLLRNRHPDSAKRRELGREVPVGRLGQPEDIAYLTLFLLSEFAGYIAGQSIFVDGGRTFCK